MALVGTLPVYQLIVESDIGGNQIRNVFYYEATVDPLPGTGWDNLVNAFDADVLPTWALAVSDNWAAYNLVCSRLNNLTDFGEFAVTHTGAQTGTNLANFVSAPFKILRGSKETRNGAKRLAGVTEDMVTANAFVAPHIANLEAVAAVFDDNLTDGGVTFAPVLVGNKYDGNTLLPESQWTVNTTIGVQFVNRVTSQNSRKIGVGI